jgi:ketosteroid isomerase-like protein
MAAGELDLLRHMYAAWNRGDVDALIETFDVDAEVRPAMSAFLASTIYRGHQGVAEWFADTYEPWAELAAEPARFIEAGDRIVVIVELHARVPGGQVEIESEIAHIATVRDGKIVALDGYDDADAALAAAGMPA